MTSPSCDWAYSLMPTVAVSPSFLTHSWVSAYRVPLGSGIATPFPSFRIRPLVKGQWDRLSRGRRASHLDAEPGPGRGQCRWHVGHRDVVPEGEGDVTRADRTHAPTVVEERVPVPRNVPIQHPQPDQNPLEPPLSCPEHGVAPDEIFIEAERPIEPR